MSVSLSMHTHDTHTGRDSVWLSSFISLCACVCPSVCLNRTMDLSIWFPRAPGASVSDQHKTLCSNQPGTHLWSYEKPKGSRMQRNAQIKCTSVPGSVSSPHKSSCTWDGHRTFVLNSWFKPDPLHSPFPQTPSLRGHRQAEGISTHTSSGWCDSIFFLNQPFGF